MEERFWHKSYPPGIRTSIDYKKITCSGALTRAAEEFPDKAALDFMGKKFTFKEFATFVIHSSEYHVYPPSVPLTRFVD